METPSSMRRATRSQTSSASSIKIMSRKESEEKKMMQERSALLDITNDSPIVGLAGGALETLPSFSEKSRDRTRQTPRTGEVLLRGQVKILLQKIEEGSDLPKLSFDQLSSSDFHGEITSSPSPAIFAPTPANTPNMSHGSACNEINKIPPTIPETKEPNFTNTQVTDDLYEGISEIPESPIPRALLFSDSCGKSEISDSSTLTFEGSSSCFDRPDADDDDASMWSVQVNASFQGDLDLEVCEEVEAEVGDHYYEEQGEEEDDLVAIDELCQGMEGVCFVEKGRIAGFKGRHTRFIYNSDDELEGEVTVTEEEDVSSGVLRLKGMPTPAGKHLRFPDDEDDDDKI